MIETKIIKKKTDSNRSRVIDTIKAEPGIMTRNIVDRLLDLTKHEVENALSALRQMRSLVCSREPGLPGHWYVLNDPYSASNETSASPPSKPKPACDNLAPGTLINKMAGIYTQASATPMRQGANDHMRYCSLRGDVRVEHRAPIGMQFTPRHIGSRVADDLNFILKQAREKIK